MSTTHRSHRHRHRSRRHRGQSSSSDCLLRSRPGPRRRNSRLRHRSRRHRLRIISAVGSASLLEATSPAMYGCRSCCASAPAKISAGRRKPTFREQRTRFISVAGVAAIAALEVVGAAPACSKSMSFSLWNGDKMLIVQLHDVLTLCRLSSMDMPNRYPNGYVRRRTWGTPSRRTARTGC